MDRDLSCRELVDLVTDYLEAGLPAREHERFQQHIASCEGCDHYVEIRTTIDLMRRSRQLEEHPEVTALLEAFRGYRQLV